MNRGSCNCSIMVCFFLSVADFFPVKDVLIYGVDSER